MFSKFNKLFLLISIGLFSSISTLSANTITTENTSFPKQIFQQVKGQIEDYLYKEAFTNTLFSKLSNQELDKEYTLLADVTLPYTEDFETATTGDPGTLPTGWINDSTDGTGNCAGTGGSLNAAQCDDWQVHSGATPSASPIGPNADHTTGSGIYVYYEDSGNPNTEANLLTPSFDLTGTTNPEVSVWVYAQSDAGVVASTGGTTENLLHFDVMNSTGTTVVAADITMTVGDNDFSDWVQYSINLSDYINSGEIRLRFRVSNNTSTTGSHDIALDDFVIQDVGVLPNTGLTCTPVSTAITGKVFEDFDFDGSNDFGETFGFNGVTVTATDAAGSTVSTTTDASGNYTLAGLTANTDYRVEFSNLPAGTSPTFNGTDNGTTVQFIQSGNCANLGVLDISNGCLFRDGSGGTGDSPGWLNIGDTSNPADGNSYSTTVNGSSITHNSANQIGRGAVNYEYWILDNHIRVRDFLGFLNAVDPTNSTERWEGGLLHFGIVTYDDSEPIGSRWKTLDRNTCTQVLTAAQVELMILNYTSFKVAARYANWAATGDINQGAYTFSNTFSADADITAIDSNWEGLRLITEDEIYKALYWDQANLTYNLYGTTTLQANGTPIVSDVDSDGLLTVSNGNVYNISSGCFKLIRTKQGGLSPYGLYFGTGDYHDMVVPHDVTFPMTTNVVRPDNQLRPELNMRSSFRLDTDLSYDEAFPSPGFRLAASSNPCVRAIQIGNYIWNDADDDGIQDANEVGIDGVTVELLRSGVAIASTQTANGGAYYFSSTSADDANLTWTGTGADTALIANTTYTIRISNAEGGSQQAALTGFVLGTTDANSNNSDEIDSDASLNGNNAEMTATTGADGEVDHSFDVGFRSTTPTLECPFTCSTGQLMSWADPDWNNGTGWQDHTYGVQTFNNFDGKGTNLTATYSGNPPSGGQPGPNVYTGNPFGCTEALRLTGANGTADPANFPTETIQFSNPIDFYKLYVGGMEQRNGSGRAELSIVSFSHNGLLIDPSGFTYTALDDADVAYQIHNNEIYIYGTTEDVDGLLSIESNGITVDEIKWAVGEITNNTQTPDMYTFTGGNSSQWITPFCYNYCPEICTTNLTTHTVDWSQIGWVNPDGGTTYPYTQTFTNIDGSGIDMTVTVHQEPNTTSGYNMANPGCASDRCVFDNEVTTYMPSREVLRLFKQDNAMADSITISFSAPVLLDNFMTGGERPSGSATFGVSQLSFWDGANKTGNKVSANNCSWNDVAAIDTIDVENALSTTAPINILTGTTSHPTDPQTMGDQKMAFFDQTFYAFGKESGLRPWTVLNLDSVYVQSIKWATFGTTTDDPATAENNIVASGNLSAYITSFNFMKCAATTCDLAINTTYSDNCTDNNDGTFTARWNLGITASTAPDNAISYQRNSEAVQSHTLTGTTDTIQITGIPADGGLYDTLRVYFTNDVTCGDTIILKRPVSCPTTTTFCAVVPDGGFESGNFPGNGTTTAFAGGTSVNFVDQSPDSWSPATNTNFGENHWIESTAAYSGNKYVYQFSSGTTTASNDACSQYDVSGLSGATCMQICVYAADANADGNSSGLAIEIQEFPSNNFHYENVELVENPAWDDNALTNIPWQQYCYTFTTQANTDSGRIWISASTEAGTAATSYVVVDDMSVCACGGTEVQAGDICSTVGSNAIAGTVFEDWNYDGVMNQSDTVGVAGVQVNLYDDCGNVDQTTYTDGNGNYQFIGLTTGTTYRVEFSLPESVACWAKPTQVGADNGTTVQFVQPGNCASLGLASPSNYCNTAPNLVLNCYIAGDPLADPSSDAATQDALVSFPYNSSGDGRPTGSNPAMHDATTGQIGSTWGIAYDRNNQRVYAAAFTKRHVGFGPLGEGGIYTIDYSTGTAVVSNFVDVNTIGINTGQVGTGATIQARHLNRGLTTNPAAPSSGDSLAFDAVGKTSLGDIDYDETNGILYVVNLFDQTLNAIVVDSDNNPATAPTAADVTTYAIPNPCNTGSVRPFALKIWKAQVYVGGVCEEEPSASVYQLLGNNFVPVLIDGSASIPLTYTKGVPASNTGDCGDPASASRWNNWVAEYPSDGLCNNSTSDDIYIYPTPILSDIEFDVDGSMILGFLDRTSAQIGFNSRKYNENKLELYFASGDILRVCNVNGSLVMEGGTGCASNANNNQGPNGGEFYHNDRAGSHQETSLGGLALVPLTREVVTTTFRGFNNPGASGGINWFNNTDGTARDPGYYVYSGHIVTNNGTFGKAQGIGDVEAFCELPPLEIGNYVWEDTDSDGIQDACESPLQNVIITLYNTACEIVAIDTTDANGQYYFNDAKIAAYTAQTDTTLATNSTYHLVISAAVNGTWNTGNNTLSINNTTYELTTANQGANDLIDSDATIGTAASACNGVTDNFVFVTATTGEAGCADHSFDIGFIPQNCSLEIVSATPTDCNIHNNSYALNVNVNYSTAPTGNLQFVVADTFYQVSPNGSGSETFTLLDLPAKGLDSLDISSFFVQDSTCLDTLKRAYLPPAGCRSDLVTQDSCAASDGVIVDLLANPIVDDTQVCLILNDSINPAEADSLLLWVFSRGNKPDSVRFTSDNGLNITLEKDQGVAASGNGFYYRTLINADGSSNYCAQTFGNNQNNERSFGTYVFHSPPEGDGAVSTIFVGEYLYWNSSMATNPGTEDCLTRTVSVVAGDEANRDILLQIAIDDLEANDPRTIDFEFTAGAINDTYIRSGPTFAQGSVGVYQFTLSNVPQNVTDVDITICSRQANNGQSLFFTGAVLDATAGCAVCDLTVNSSQTCQDNGTGGDSNDDYFVLSLDVSAVNGGASNMFEVLNTANSQVIGTGTYGTTLMIEWADMAQTMRFAADGTSTYNLVVRDVDDNTCTEMITTLSEASCSACPPQICLPIKTTIKRSGGTN